MTIGYFNGEFIDVEKRIIPIDERGHQFGDGVYEVIRIYNGNFFMLEEHIQRLFNSAQAIRLTIVQTNEEIQDIIYEAVEKSSLKDCDVYIQITRGIAERKHLFPDTTVSISMTVRPMKVTGLSVRTAGRSAIFHPDERWGNCYIKSLNLLPNILAKQCADDAKCYEAILVKDGFVTEGTSSNVYIVKNNSIYTTPLSKHILSGITRMAVKDLANTLNIPFIEKQFTSNDLLEADEVFITSATNEVMPISTVEGKKIGNGVAGEITMLIFEKFIELVQNSTTDGITL